MKYSEIYGSNGYGYENEEISDNSVLKNIVYSTDIHKLSSINRNISVFDLPIIENHIKTRILESSELSNEAKLEFLFNEAYRMHNMFAHYEIAKLYKMGSLLDQSDTEYIRTLQQIISSKIYASKTDVACRKLEDYTIHQYYDVFQYIDLSEWYTTSLLCSSYYELGIYYEGSNELEDLIKSRNYFYAGARLDPSDSHSKDIKIVEEKIIQIEQRNKTKTEYKDTLPETSSILFENIKTALVKDFTEEKWELLTKETHSYLLTSYYCFKQLQQLGNTVYGIVDFGGVINMTLKSLEYELGERFHKQYLSYLISNVKDYENFCSLNEISKNIVTKERKDLIFYNRVSHKIEFYNPQEHCSRFTIGSFSFITGIKIKYNPSENKIDKTVIQYVKSTLFPKYNISDEEITNWIIDLGTDIEVLRKLRNDASHGGKIMTIYDAEECFNFMLYTKKILLRLLNPLYPN